MLRLLPLLGVAYSTNTVTNVVCNGKDQIQFDVNGPGLGSWYRFEGCNDASKNGDAPAGSVSKSLDGESWTMSFNPYTHCEGSWDRNDASSFSVDMKFIISASEVIGGATVYLRAVEVHLKCTFENSYEVTADLGQLKITPGQVGTPIDGPEFTIGFDMHRWTTSYLTAAATTDQVIAYNPVKFYVFGNTAFSGTKFNMGLAKVVLKKKGQANPPQLTIFDHSTGCGITELGFGKVPGVPNMSYAKNFQYKAIFLDADIDANYEVVVTVVACHEDATSTECTKFNTCNA